MKYVAIAVLFISLCVRGADYYVDAGRTSNGSGTEASPWKEWSDINWSTVAAPLASEDVTIYLSSRATWSGGQYFTIQCSGTAARALAVNGDSKYNLTASGAASWLAESSGARAQLSGGGAFIITNSTTNITIRGLQINSTSFGCSIGDSNPSTNISLITLTNCFVNGSGQQGFFFGYAEAGCHSFKVSHCIVSNTQLESIYIGHYNFMTQTITNCVVEHNTVIDCGLFDEGEMDLKPPVHGAIVRYNRGWRTVPGLGGSSCGVVVAGNNAQIYGNEWFGQEQGGDTDWGYAIQINADGADGTGVNITNALIYNNLLYANESAGIRLIATTAPGAISGVQMFNNTMFGNQRLGLELRASGGRTVVVSEMTNNIFVGNTNYDVSVQNADCAIANANHNLYYRASGNPFFYQTVEKSFAQWQALNFDSAGLNSDPLFVSAAASDFRLSAGSPAISVGADLSGLFTVDINGDTRSMWDLGAIKYTAIASRPPIISLRTLGTR